MESSSLIGIVKYTPKAEIRYAQDPRQAETFLFELADLMKQYEVVKLDVCFDPFTFNQTQ